MEFGLFAKHKSQLSLPEEKIQTIPNKFSYDSFVDSGNVIFDFLMILK
jgi:hypothetical protein